MSCMADKPFFVWSAAKLHKHGIALISGALHGRFRASISHNASDDVPSHLLRRAKQMSAAVLQADPLAPMVPQASAKLDLDRRTQALLHAPMLPLLLRLAWPNVLVMLAQASTGLIETWWVSKLGTDALAGMALVFPGVMLMQMISAGAIGGGISSAVARALGAGRRADADALVLHAVLVNLGLGLAMSVLFLVFGRPLYAAMGGRDG